MISSTVEKKRKGNEGDGEAYYSVSDLSWFASTAHNKAIQHKMIGDNEVAKQLFAISLNLLPYCTKELQSYRSVINEAFTQANASSNRDVLANVLNLVE